MTFLEKGVVVWCEEKLCVCGACRGRQSTAR
jgi:hypothetical protein